MLQITDFANSISHSCVSPCGRSGFEGPRSRYECDSLRKSVAGGHDLGSSGGSWRASSQLLALLAEIPEMHLMKSERRVGLSKVTYIWRRLSILTSLIFSYIFLPKPFGKFNSVSFSKSLPSQLFIIQAPEFCIS